MNLFLILESFYELFIVERHNYCNYHYDEAEQTAVLHNREQRA